MQTKVNYFKIGLFVIVSVIAVIAGLIAFGQNVLNKQKIYIETYLNETVQGLNIDSPVYYRGIRLGKVSKISLVGNEYQLKQNDPNYNKYRKYIMIKIAIDDTQDYEKIQLLVRDLIDEGLRIRLASQALTGIAYLEIDYVNPDDNQPLDIAWKPESMYIPSAKSMLNTFISSAEKTFKRFNEMKIEETIDEIHSTLVNLNESFTKEKIDELIIQMQTLLTEFNAAVKDVRPLLAEKSPDTDTVTIPMMITRLDKTLMQIEQIAHGQNYNLKKILDNASLFINELRELTNDLKQNPSRLIFQSPPKKSETVK